MKETRHLLLLLAMMLMSWSASAQSIKSEFDKKIILVDSLNLPNNTSAATLISFLPELLQRPGDYILSNYDLQVDGLSVGEATDVALYELQIVDIESIEVSESPVSSFQKNGEGGSINMILRKGTKDDKWLGSVGLSTSNPLDISPQLNLAYKTDKFMIRGVMLAEIYQNRESAEYAYYKNGVYQVSDVLYEKERFNTELARIYMQYHPTTNDNFDFKVSEIHTYEKDIDIKNHGDEPLLDKRSESTSVQAQFGYSHKAGSSTLSTAIQYEYKPTNSRQDVPNKTGSHGSAKGHSLAGQVQYSASLLSKPTASGIVRQLNLASGINFNMTHMSEIIGINDVRYNYGQDLEQTPHSMKLHLMPFLSIEGTYGKFRMKAVGEYQHLKYDISRTETPYKGGRRDFTGKLMTEWHFTPHKNLRFILDHKIDRGSDAQIYPYLTFDVETMMYQQGNTELVPMKSHEMTVDYLSDYRWSEHSLIFNVGASYNYVYDIIHRTTVENGSTDGGFGQTLKYNTYSNYGKCGVASANLMAVYSYKDFTLSATGNFYHQKHGEEDDFAHYTYYNFSVHPYFNLLNGWHGGLKFTYHSRIDRQYGNDGDCASANITIGRAWQKFFVYVSQTVGMQKYATSVYDLTDERLEIMSDMIPNSITAGIKYRF